MSTDIERDLEVEIERLRGLDLQGLRLQWRTTFGRTAPQTLPKGLLFRLFAYRLQAEALGDLSKETRQFLDRVGRQKDRGDEPIPIPGQDKLAVGTVLLREHDGHKHRVTVNDDGFSWNGTTYASLSKVAQAITGTRWNGPRFFGLRSGKL